MAEPLSQEQIATALTELPGWEQDADSLAKTFVFKGFRTAMAAMLRLSYECDAANHHPAWRNVYNRVEVRLTTHSAGGRITENDVALARRFENALRTSGLELSAKQE